MTIKELKEAIKDLSDDAVVEITDYDGEIADINCTGSNKRNDVFGIFINERFEYSKAT